MVSIYIRLGLSRLVCISKFAIWERVMILFIGILIRVKRVTTWIIKGRVITYHIEGVVVIWICLFLRRSPRVCTCLIRLLPWIHISLTIIDVINATVRVRRGFDKFLRDLLWFIAIIRHNSALLLLRERIYLARRGSIGLAIFMFRII